MNRIATLHRKVDRCWRLSMRCWSIRWKVIRSDPVERDDAKLFLANAIRCREKPGEWQNHNPHNPEQIP